VAIFLIMHDANEVGRVLFMYKYSAIGRGGIVNSVSCLCIW